jgi:hypothetical protein
MRRAFVVLVGLVVLAGCASAPAAEPLVTGTPTVAPEQTAEVTPSRATPSASPVEVDERAAKLNSALYRAGAVAAVKCKIPGGALRTNAALLAYSKAVAACLDLAWKPVLERASLDFRPAPLYSVERSAATGCSDAHGLGAFYCGGTEAIYVDANSEWWRPYRPGSHTSESKFEALVLFTIAHEYGHHVQQLTGILTLDYGTGTLEESRRLELQASCFAYAFLGANRATFDLYGERLAAIRWPQGSGDRPNGPRDHGSRKNHVAWSESGFAAKSPAACNTWTASAKKVS